MGGTPETSAAFRAWIAETLSTSIPDGTADGAGVSLSSSDGSREVLFASNDLAGSLEQLQFTLGEGPSVDASTTGSTVLVADLNDPGDGLAGRWPVFVEHATRAGVSAVFAFPIRIGAILLGALDVYRLTPGPLAADELSATLETVDALGLRVLGLRSAEGDMNGSGDPVWSNMTVHRAAGMVMVQMEATIQEALLRLRAAAYAEDTPINEIAADVVTGRRRFPKES